MDYRNCGHTGCHTSDTHSYYFPDSEHIYLCDTHAQGLFCPCGNFIGGSEDAFWYGGLCEDCYAEIAAAQDGGGDSDVL